MLNIIKVKKTTNPDEGYEDISILFNDTLQHKKDVEKVMNNIATVIINRGKEHDWSKIKYFDQFAKDTLERKNTPDFKSREWYKIHTVEERHHINANTPKDIDLIDILEFICDCVVAGKTRTSKVNKDFLVLNEILLEEAYWNTVEKIIESITVEE